MNAEPFLLTGTAATVGKRLITIADAYAYNEIEHIRQKEALSFKTDPALLKKIVQKMVFEEMVYQEMMRLKAGMDVGGRATEILRAFKAREPQAFATLTRVFKRDLSTLAGGLARTLVVEQFLEKKVETLTPIITDADVEKYFKQNQSKLGNDGDEDRAAITKALKKERMQRGFEEWVRSLREKCGVTNHLATFMR